MHANVCILCIIPYNIQNAFTLSYIYWCVCCRRIFLFYLYLSICVYYIDIAYMVIYYIYINIYIIPPVARTSSSSSSHVAVAVVCSICAARYNHSFGFRIGARYNQRASGLGSGADMATMKTTATTTGKYGEKVESFVFGATIAFMVTDVLLQINQELCRCSFLYNIFCLFFIFLFPFLLLLLFFLSFFFYLKSWRKQNRNKLLFQHALFLTYFCFPFVIINTFVEWLKECRW